MKSSKLLAAFLFVFVLMSSSLLYSFELFQSQKMPVQNDQSLRIAVLDFTSKSIEPNKTEKITNSIYKLFKKNYGNNLTVLDKGIQETIVWNSGLMNIDFSEDPDSLQRVGELLNVNYLIFGNLSADQNNVFKINCHLYKVATGEKLYSIEVVDYSYKGAVSQLANAVYKIATAIIENNAKNPSEAKLPDKHFINKNDWETINSKINEFLKSKESANAKIKELENKIKNQEKTVSSLNSSMKEVDKRMKSSDLTNNIQQLQGQGRTTTLLTPENEDITTMIDDPNTTQTENITTTDDTIEAPVEPQAEENITVQEDTQPVEEVEQTTVENTETAAPAEANPVEAANTPAPKEPEPAAQNIEPTIAQPQPKPEVKNDKETAKQLFNEVSALSMDSQEALDKMRKAVQLDPTNITYIGSLALIYFTREDYDNALIQSNEALKIDPENSNILSLLGSTYFELNDFENAAKEQAAALKNNPDNLNAQYNLALSLMKAGKNEESVKEWTVYVNKAKDVPSQAKWLENATEYLKQLQSGQ